MSRVSCAVLRKYILAGQLSSRGCLRRPISLQRNARITSIRYLTTNELPPNTNSEAIVPLRKELKDEKKRQKQLAKENGETPSNNKQQSLEDWELTVGIEIHAQLNTPRKLFSSAASTIGGTPNSHVAFFDLAIPGTQPHFQKECLIPAMRAAMALGCSIQPVSTFDRKHYFHWDQPNGYQITQYYQPFAKEGCITLYKHDGIAEEDGEQITIGIKQVQMEQDTAKTIAQPDDIHLIDYNRVGVPLIEIITLPQIHHPATAAALVRKVQILLNSVDACVLGMESGGLRADVNVSVKRRNVDTDTINTKSYAGINNLSQHTEIKNLSSFKAVEAAIIAERNRQISVLEAGGVIESETRGWTLGSTETKRLRGKEGAVDYRYMPDPDIAPIRIGADLITHLRNSMGTLPDQEIELLNEQYGLTIKDALSLISLDSGARAEYFYEVIKKLEILDSWEDPTSLGVYEIDDEMGHGNTTDSSRFRDLREMREAGADPEKKWGRMVGNWVLHELGGLISTMSENDVDVDMPNLLADSSSPSSPTTIPIPVPALAQILHLFSNNHITNPTAKKLVSLIFQNPSLLDPNPEDENSPIPTITGIITENNWWFRPLQEHEYKDLAEQVIRDESKAWEDVLKGQKGKIMFLVGKMMKSEAGREGRVVAKMAEDVLKGLVEEDEQKRAKVEEEKKEERKGESDDK